MIQIMNLRGKQPKFSHDVRVDRKSPLGNPFELKNQEDRRDEVCDMYREYMGTILDGEHDNKPLTVRVVAELRRLKVIHRRHKALRLFCWCTPKRCHAETIREVLLDESYNFLLDE